MTVGMRNKCNVIKKVKSASGKKDVALRPLVLSVREQSNSRFYSRAGTEIPRRKTVAKQS